MEDPSLSALLLDEPQLMGVESIELDTVNLRMVARTLPGKQFEVGRRIRVLVVRALRRAGIVAPTDGSTPMVEAIVASGDDRRRRGRDPGSGGAEEMTSWLKAQARPHAGLDGGAHRRVRRTVLGVPQFRTQPRPPPRRRRLRSSRRASCPTRTTPGCRARTCGGPRSPTTTTTTTTSPTDTTTTSPTSPTETTPTTTVVDPDGFGPLPPTTQTMVTPTPVTTTPTLPGPTPTTTTPPS